MKERRIIFVLRFESGATKLFKSKIMYANRMEKAINKIMSYTGIKWIHIHEVDSFAKNINRGTKIGFATKNNMQFDW